MFRSRIWIIATFLIALLPSIWFVAGAKGLPHLGHFHDDGIYVGTAASIAEGKGPRVESLPGEPWQVRYPPLFSLYLAPGVGNEALLAILLWLTLPALLYLAWLWRGDGLLVLLLGWNAYAVLFAGSALSEMFATVWLLATVCLLERGRVRQSSITVSAAFLARTAMVAGASGAALWLLWKRRWRDAIGFCAVFLPVFAGWAWFSAAHLEPSTAETRDFYLTYARFYAHNVNLEILPDMLWLNLQMLVAGAGGLLFFNGGDSVLEGNFARLLLFAAVSGLIRQARRDGVGPYPFIAVVHCTMLVVWNYIPQERFLFPILPLLLDGFLTELRHIAEIVAGSWRKQRAAAVILGGLIAAGLLWGLHRQVISAWTFAPSIPVRYLAQRTERSAAFEWIRANTPPEADFLAADDHILRRETGRHGIGFHFPTRLAYKDDHASILAYHRDVVPRMKAEGLTYLLIGPNDLELDLRPADREKVIESWIREPQLETVYENRLYRVRRLIRR